MILGPATSVFFLVNIKLKSCLTDLQCHSFVFLLPQFFFHFLHVSSDQKRQKQKEEFADMSM